jgi:hypothetical protein
MAKFPNQVTTLPTSGIKNDVYDGNGNLTQVGDSYTAELFMEQNGEIKAVQNEMLLSDNIRGTTQIPTYSENTITKVEHKSGAAVLRTDNFIYTTTLITETRTLATGESISFKYNFDANGHYVSTEVI